VEKLDLDDDQPHESRNKGSAASQVHAACFEGVFPGWQSEFPGIDNPNPKPIFNIQPLSGRMNVNQERCSKAERALGIKLGSNATWLFPHFDCYIQVQSNLICIDFCFS
jgi:hypothetical protein